MGCLAAAKMCAAFSIPTVSSVGEWKISSALRSLAMRSVSFCCGDVGQEFAADAERPAGQRDLDLAVLADGVELVLEQMRDVAGIAGRGDRHHRPRLRDRIGRRQHRGAAEAVADQQRRRPSRLAQMVGGGDQVGDIGRERGVGEFALARTDAGEVETQYRDAERRQRIGDALRRHHVLAAGEAVREQRIGARLPAGRSSTAASFSPFALGKSKRSAGMAKLPAWVIAESLAQARIRTRINSRHDVGNLVTLSRFSYR